MLDFQATDAVGMRVQSVAKIDGEPSRGNRAGGRKRFRKDEHCTIATRLGGLSNRYRLTKRQRDTITAVVEFRKIFGFGTRTFGFRLQNLIETYTWQKAE